MGRSKLAKLSGTAGCIAFALGTAPAQASDGLSCLDAPFNPNEEILIEEYQAAIDIDFVRAPKIPDQMKVILAGRLADCRESESWSSEAYTQAAEFYGPHFMAKLLRSRMPLNSEQLAQLDERFAEADKDRLLRGLMGENEEDKTYATKIARLSGTEDSYETGVWIGALITVMIKREEAMQAFLAS